MFIETTIGDFPTAELGLLQIAFGSSRDNRAESRVSLKGLLPPSMAGAIGDGVPVDDDPTEPLTSTGLTASRSPSHVVVQVRELTVGCILRSRYVLDDVIGQGGDAIVFRARDLRHASPGSAGNPCVAIKALLPDKRDDPNALRRLQREFRQMQRLEHPGIARQYDLDCDGGIWFISMELIEGCTVRTWLAKSRSIDQALTLIRGCCAALDHAHSLGIVHGDLKPTNVLVVGGGRVKLIDFGCASEMRVPTPVEASSTAVTASFASPEVLGGNPVEERDDIFSMACLSYVILSQGKCPFGNLSPLAAYQTGCLPDRIPGLSSRLNQALMRGLAPERAQRPASASEFFRLLECVDGAGSGGDSTVSSEAAPRQVAGESVALASAIVVDVDPKRPAPPPIGIAPARGSLVPTPFSAALVTGPRLRDRTTSAQSGLASLLFLALREPCRFASGRRSATRGAAAAVLLTIGVGALLLIHDKSERIAGPVLASSAVTTSKPSMSLTSPMIASAPSPEASPAIKEVARKSPASGRITFDSNAIRIVPGQSLVAIPIKRLEPTREPAWVAWAIENGNPSSAAPRAKQNLVRFIEGQAVRSIFIPLAGGNAPTPSYGTGTFAVVLRKVAGGPPLGPFSRVTVSISPPRDPQLASDAP